MNFRSIRFCIALAAAVIVSIVPTPAVATTGAMRTPIEVEPGAVPCGPGSVRFDRGLRQTLHEQRLAVTAGGRPGRSIANEFCLASERPGTKPVRVRVRIRSDGGSIHDFATASDAIRRADHWLIHVGVPFGGLRLAPARWQRMSLWARADRESYCEDMGRVTALAVLEALSREKARVEPDEQLDLGRDVRRDAKYSESDEGAWKTFVHDLPYVIPTAVLWLIVLTVAFAFSRWVQRARRHVESADPIPPKTF